MPISKAPAKKTKFENARAYYLDEEADEDIGGEDGDESYDEDAEISEVE